jgi:hypothetical protein
MGPVRKKLSQKRIESDTENQMPLVKVKGLYSRLSALNVGIPHTASELVYIFG